MAKKTKKAKKAKRRNTKKRRTRWFRVGPSVREYPSCRTWVNGTLMEGKTLSSMQGCIDLGDIELDGPPPNGKPIRSKE
jgi:hypothetical protein